MVRDFLFVKNLTNHKPAANSCPAGLAVTVLLRICSAPQTIQADPPVPVSQTTVRDFQNAKEQQPLKKHILVITSRPDVTGWFFTLKNALRQNIFASLSSDNKLGYEFIGGERLTDTVSALNLTDMLREKDAAIKLDRVIGCSFVKSRRIFLAVKSRLKAFGAQAAPSV